MVCRRRLSCSCALHDSGRNQQRVCQRSIKTWKSEYTGGLDRIVNVYDMEGDLIATYEGKIDIQENDSKVLFELNGKRYTYYNCLVEVIEK